MERRRGGDDDINHWSIALYVCNFLLIHMCALYVYTVYAHREQPCVSAALV